MKKGFLFISAFIVLGLAGFITIKSINAACSSGGSSCNENVTVEVQVSPGDISIGTTGTFSFGTLTSSSSSQTATGAFSDEFWVEDLKGDDAGYYTTLQLSGALQAGSNTIPSSSVSVKTENTGSAGITLMAGTTNSLVEVDSAMSTFQTLDGASTFIKRDTAANAGVVGQYGAFPVLEVVVPAYQAVGTYTGSLVYTLIEN